jgi:hypothetical protein
MEDVLSVCELPYDPDFPVVCLDESLKQLVGQVRPPIPMAPGQSLRVDDEYVRKGTAEIFMAVEPLGGKRFVEVTERRTRREWAKFVRDLPDVHYPRAKKIRLVEDNLNIHSLASLYEAFPPREARRIADRLELHFTPKHGSWLNIAEIELSAYKRPCICGRIDAIERMREMTRAWNEDRNTRQTQVDWQFSVDQARNKQKRLYPKF